MNFKDPEIVKNFQPTYLRRRRRRRRRTVLIEGSKFLGKTQHHPPRISDRIYAEGSISRKGRVKEGGKKRPRRGGVYRAAWAM